MTDSCEVTVWLIPVLQVLGDAAARDLRQRTKAFWFKSFFFN